MRDIVLEETFYMDFTTRAFTTGIPTVLSGTPVLSVLEENNATPITAGVSVSVDRASVVGLNMATIVATAANGYETGKGYSIYISTGTVGGVSVVGEVVGQFTVDASAAAQDLANGTDGLGAIKTAVDAIPTTAMRGTDSALLASGYTAPDNSGIAGIQTDLDNATDGLGAIKTAVDAIPTTAMRGTDSALLASGYTAPDNAGISGIQTDLDNATDGLGAIKTAVDAIPTTAMRGTDSAALASVATEARLSELDAVTAGKMANQIDIIQTDTTTDIPGQITGLNDVAATEIVSAGAITTLEGAVVTVTNNSDMRGTDSANTVAPDNASITAIKTTTDKFAFTIANRVDSNMHYVNDQVISGDGGVGTEFQGA